MEQCKTKSSAMLNQIRTFDVKHVKYRSGKISKEDFENIKIKLIELIKKLPHSKEGERTKAKVKNSISNKNKNVKEINK